MSLTVKSFEILPEHNVYGFIFQLIYFYSIGIQTTISSNVMETLKNLLFWFDNINRTSAVIVTPSNASV